MLAIKLLLRNWRSGELGLMTASILLAVCIVGAVSVFSQRLERSMLNQSSDALGADGIVTSRQANPPAWETEVQAFHIRTSKITEFEAMLIAGEEMTLASVKAVDQNYPLRGRLEVRPQTKARESNELGEIPAAGTAWIDARLLSALKIGLGARIRLGELELTVTEVLSNDPGLFSFKSRILIHQADLPKTGLLQAGSRIAYKWLMASDNHQELQAFITSLKKQLTPEQALVTPESMVNNRGDAMKSIRHFLMLSSIFAVLLCGLAIAISSRQFAHKQLGQIALLKSFGYSARNIRKMLLWQLLAIATLATLFGLFCGSLMQTAAASFLLHTYQFKLLAAQSSDYTLSLLCGVLCLCCFTLPAVWHLPALPPMQVLRGHVQLPAISVLKRLLPASLAIFLLIFMLSKDVLVNLIVIASLSILLLLLMGIAKCLLSVLRVPMENMGGSWRLALSRLQGQQWQGILQIAVFAVVILALSSLVALRQSLTEQWQAQFPPQAPNHFLANISASELPELRRTLVAHGIKPSRFDPMVLGRITHINGLVLANTDKSKSKIFEREMEISWSPDLPAGNLITEGQWRPQAARDKSVPGVSVEKEFAVKAGLHLADQLEFFIGGWSQPAIITSIREIKDSARSSSFTFLFEADSLQPIVPTYVTEFYVNPTEKNWLYTLSMAHPGILIIEADRMLALMNSMVRHASLAMLGLLLLSLLAGFLVMLATVLSSMQDRKQESAVLRAFGCSAPRLLGSIWLEFFIMGLIAGSIATAGTQALQFALHKIIFKAAMQTHLLLLLSIPVASALLLSLIGVWACRQAIKTPPATVLR
ncbi:ABC transporter permease [Undibacterium sp. Di27W]|uniref:ABC transporter permease n=1 Tax=Undibacterium sp. Di27W TaxID=3413036 RepID=UPI003BF26459